MIDVTDSFYVYKFFRMLLITELIRRELRLLTAHARSFHSLPSGTQGRGQLTRVSAQQQIVQGGNPSRTSGEGQPKPGRRHTVHRKWALSRVFAPSISRSPKNIFLLASTNTISTAFLEGAPRGNSNKAFEGKACCDTTNQSSCITYSLFHAARQGAQLREHKKEEGVGAKAPTK